MLFVIVEVVLAEVGDADHAVGVGGLLLYIYAALADARDDRIELLADPAGQELNLLHLDAVALGIGGRHLALGGVEGERVELRHLFFGNRVAASMSLDKPVDEEVRIATDGGGEVGIKVECEPEVADVIGGVDGLRHGAQRSGLDQVFLRFALDRGEKLI